MAIPKWAQAKLKSLESAVERLQRKVDNLNLENVQLARELKLATEDWSDEDRDNNRRKAKE